jgi:hypothetical protein
MSLFSSIILPQLEKELIAASPEISGFIFRQLGNAALEVINWIEKKSTEINQSKIDASVKKEK